VAASDPRALASRLAELDDAVLADLFAARHVSSSVSWSDFFDAAEALLDAGSLARAITALTRAEADALAAGTVPAGEVRDALVRRALVDADGVPYDAVRAALAATTPAARPAAPAPGAADAPSEPDEHAAERAFAASAALADILYAAMQTPLSRIGSGALGATDRRRLVEIGAAADADEADEIVAIGERVGFLTAADRLLLVTADGAAWLRTGTVARWQDVAERLRDALPAALRTPDGGWMPVAAWTGAHPFDAAWPAEAQRLRALLQRWALFGANGEPAGWAAGLSHGGNADIAHLQSLLPPEVDKVFLQNDLTAIAPGPLQPQLDLRLRAMTRRESRAQAATYRFTAETLTAALTAGETADSLRAFLQELSLTGLPQPLAYEIERSASRHGALRVGPDWSGRTRVTADDDALLRTVAVDQALRPLGLVDDGEGLVSRSSADTVFWMLADARYPVVAVDADGQRRTLDRHRIADEHTGDAASTDRYAPLLGRLRSAHDQDADTAWLGRELEQAVRARAVIVVTVALPDGSQREFTVEATGIGGGRLRGRDRAADVERTLPVSSISLVRPA